LVRVAHLPPAVVDVAHFLDRPLPRPPPLDGDGDARGEEDGGEHDRGGALHLRALSSEDAGAAGADATPARRSAQRLPSRIVSSMKEYFQAPERPIDSMPDSPG